MTTSLFLDGDGGWVFPTRAHKSKHCYLCAELGLSKKPAAGGVVRLVEGKQQHVLVKNEKPVNIIPTPHRLRDTYTMALVEVGGISPFAIIEHSICSREYGTVLSLLWVPDAVGPRLGMI